VAALPTTGTLGPRPHRLGRPATDLENPLLYHNVESTLMGMPLSDLIMKQVGAPWPRSWWTACCCCCCCCCCCQAAHALDWQLLRSPRRQLAPPAAPSPDPQCWPRSLQRHLTGQAAGDQRIRLWRRRLKFQRGHQRGLCHRSPLLRHLGLVQRQHRPVPERSDQRSQVRRGERGQWRCCRRAGAAFEMGCGWTHSSREAPAAAVGWSALDAAP
jgi:hypothetical protein